MKKFLVAMSGGVDSCAAALLSVRKHGKSYTAGVTLELSEKGTPGEEIDKKNSADAKAVCDILGIEHYAVYAYPKFKASVIDPFIAEYLRGNTPNPCVTCNKSIKFGFLLDHAHSMGFDTVVTGHYARIVRENGISFLERAADLRKDQSYVLAGLSQSQLSHTELPLGEFTKDEIRAVTAEAGFPTASRKDSQDICFIPDGDYAGFIKKACGIGDMTGDYVDEEGNILGKHRGQWQYTVGQRKGLGISMGRHVFVKSKDAGKNTVVLCDEDALFTRSVRLSGISFISGRPADSLSRVYSAKLRYAHRPAECSVILSKVSENAAELVFTEAQRAPTPGQLAVVYDGGRVVMCGTIV